MAQFRIDLIFLLRCSVRDVTLGSVQVSGEGDYELKFGNPHLQYLDRWIAFEFKNTLLRVS